MYLDSRGEEPDAAFRAEFNQARKQALPYFRR
jgi:hypothetical protein